MNRKLPCQPSWHGALRTPLLAGGVALWSLATAGTAFSSNYAHMFFWRALLGVGEASYGVIAPTLIADLFPIQQRGRAMGITYVGVAVFGSLGSYIVKPLTEAHDFRYTLAVLGGMMFQGT